MKKGYRVRRPKEYDNLLSLLRDKDEGVFDSLKSALVFCAALGFKKKIRQAFSESGERIDFSIFNENQDQPFIYALALTEFNDVSYLRDSNFLETIIVFEEYAAGGLKYLDGVLDKSNIKESLEVIIGESESADLISDIADEW